MIKKIFCVVAFFIAFNFLSVLTVYADDEDEGNLAVEIHSTDLPAKKIKTPSLNAVAAIIMDMESGRVLYEKNARIRKAMASTTKIMTAIVAIENADLEEVVTVSKRAVEINGSEIHLKLGEKLKLGELLYGLMLKSGNDAAIAIAEHVGGSVEGFCELMNNKAKELGTENTHFTSPHGLDMPEHYTTAYELAKITSYALRNPIFNQIVSTKQASIPNRALSNTNELLGVYPGVDGVKTGYTGQAGRCLVSSATRNQMRVISVVLGSPTRSARAQSSTNLLNYAFSNYQLTALSLQEEIIGNVRVEKGIKPSLNLTIKDKVKLPLSEYERKVIEKRIEIPKGISAPVKKGQEIGQVRWVLNGVEMVRSTIIASEDIRRKNFYDYFIDLCNEFKSLGK